MACAFEPFADAWRYDDTGVFTITSTQQRDVEDSVAAAVRRRHSVDAPSPLADEPAELWRERHVSYMLACLKAVPAAYETLDASRPWLCYWAVHSLNLLGDELVDAATADRVVRFLKSCECDGGGYAGGPGQLAHLAPTYAAVMCLCELGTDSALHSIDRPKLLQYLLRMKRDDGSFAVHDGGEADVRGVYCALAVASLTNVLCERLLYKCDAWLVNCQTYEGGFAGLPQNPPGPEAHGGYTHCALAALTIAGRANLVADKEALVRWLVDRQMQFEGGFQGRTNKLVDSCYSFWVGACFPLVESIVHSADAEARGDGGEAEHLFDAKALQAYVLNCCQDKRGGFVDKPGKARDLYHSCYALSGLSIAQSAGRTVYGSHHCNSLNATHAAFNVTIGRVERAHQFFAAVGRVV